ncbi:MAG: hypothetical protein KGQ70_02540 [Alphaproteobacteria bacterium]|nr:hypothetical protein [Alphaproteobacteria bacterium]
MSDSEKDDVLDFTPESGFVIEKLAVSIVDMMREMDMDARLNLPDGTVIDIEKECTKQDIVAGYKEYVANSISSRPASNRNEKEPV